MDKHRLNCKEIDWKLAPPAHTHMYDCCSAGAELQENSPVTDVVFDSSTGLWTVCIEGSEVKYTGRVLVCADGAPSKLATQLGMVTEAPQGVCSRAYIKKGTHRFRADGVVFYPCSISPGNTLTSAEAILSCVH